MKMVVSSMKLKLQDENIEWCKAQQIPLSINLVGAAKQQLRVLAAVGSSGYLYDDHAIEQAIYRYKYCWLPLLAKHMESPILEGPLVVPLDCEWIWHCHRLNPVQYKRDCEEIYGKILGNLNVASTVDGTSSKQIESIWNRIYVTEPYYLDLANPHVTDNRLDAAVQRSTDYDLAAAVERQRSFSSKILKVINYDESFIEEAVDRYKAFLYLMKKSDEERVDEKISFVPTFDIDLIWHTHQLNPIAYSNDVNAIFGRVIDHNDRNTGSWVRNKLLYGFLRTRELWELTYQCMYCMEGDVTENEDDPNLNCLACVRYCIGV